ncbi:MAG: cholesterol oxidase substrate-binding domain-containing protein, partial [Pseudonocardiales bacterium]
GCVGVEESAEHRRNLPRRRFLAGSAAAGALPLSAGWMTPSGIGPSHPPPAFPSSIDLHQRRYQNWSGEITIDPVWTCVPRTPQDVVTVANWAHAHGYTIRPRGYQHNWSPLTITTHDTKVILVDTTRHLRSMRIESHSPASVQVQAGASMEELLGFLEQHGYGMAATPAPGDLSIGGVLAIDGHGTAVPASGEIPLPGHTYGSLSNLVVSLNAVVWDQLRGSYVQRTFDRAHPHCKAFLTHLGRAFLTDVTLRVGANTNLRCVSRVDIPVAELFAAADGAERTLASFVEQSGRVEAIWFPFTTNPWLKTWSISRRKPLLSRQAITPYNYVFSDNIPKPVAELAGTIVSGQPHLAPTFGQLLYDVTTAGLITTRSADLWGPSKNLLLYVKPTTLRVSANGYAVLTSRDDIQRVVHEFTAFYQERLAAYAAQHRFPVNGGVEIRVTGLDVAPDVDVAGAEPPVLSAVRPCPDRPEWDVAVWIDVLTLPGTPHANEFYRELEEFTFRNYPGSYATVRPEWSKGWAYTTDGAWTDRTLLTETVPDLYRTGPGPTWDWAVGVLDGYDPYRIFSNPFLAALLR